MQWSTRLLLYWAMLADAFFLQRLVFSLSTRSIVHASVALVRLLSVSQSYRHVWTGNSWFARGPWISPLPPISVFSLVVAAHLLWWRHLILDFCPQAHYVSLQTSSPSDTPTTSALPSGTAVLHRLHAAFSLLFDRWFVPGGRHSLNDQRQLSSVCDRLLYWSLLPGMGKMVHHARSLHFMQR